MILSSHIFLFCHITTGEGVHVQWVYFVNSLVLVRIKKILKGGSEVDNLIKYLILLNFSYIRVKNKETIYRNL